MDLQGFKFDNAPIRWELVPVDPKVTSLQLLLAKFYDEWSYAPKPIGWGRNPEDAEGRPYYDPITDWIVAPYYRGFYFTIERQYREIFGPHVLRLHYKSWQVESEIAWVAICQIEGMWHSDERMLAALQNAVNAGELYQSEKTAEIIVLL